MWLVRMQSNRPRSFRQITLAFIVALMALLAWAPGALAAGCEFVLGFKTFHDENAALTGNCTTLEQLVAGGSRVQYTTNGLLVWRPADNQVAFTNGAQTWLKGPFGLQARSNDTHFAWEAKSAETDPTVKGIFILLGRQRLLAYEDGRLVIDTPVTTGGPRSPTPAGAFSVIGKRGAFMMKSPWPEEDPRWYPDSWVNFALLFERTGFFIHDAPWRAIYGPGTNVTYNPAVDWVGTHGCVNVPYDAETKLFQWADMGTPVTVMP